MAIHSGSINQINSKNLLSMGLDYTTLLEDLVKLDYQEMEGLVEQDEGSQEQWVKIYTSELTEWCALKVKDKIIAYWHFIPIKKSTYSKMMEGKVYDSEIRLKHIEPFTETGIYTIYFAGIAVDSQYRSPVVTRVLMNCLLNRLKDLAIEGILVDNVCANAYTSDGIAFCKHFGMKHIVKHAGGSGQVYATNIDSIINTNYVKKKYPELHKLYSVRD